MTYLEVLGDSTEDPSGKFLNEIVSRLVPICNLT